MVLVLFLFCGFYYEAFHGESYLALCSHVFCSFLFSIVKERVGLYASRTFVCLSNMRNFLSFVSAYWFQGLAVT